MLSRTADNLFWIARNMERAETTARALEVGGRMSLIPAAHGYRTEWDSLLRASGTHDYFMQKYGDPVQRNLESHFFFDHDNPASVAHCFTAARENARIVRTALTSQVWDAINSAFQELRELERTARSRMDLTQLCEWTLRCAAQVRGAIEATQLRNDGWDFLRLGYAIERADNTARLMDVKYYILLPQLGFVGAEQDSAQWTTLLRAFSVHRAFHWAYGGEVTAAKIAHFLILNPSCPRSLLACIQAANSQLDRLATGYGRSTHAQSVGRALLQELSELSTDEIFDEGMHEFLTRFIAANARLGNAVGEAYLNGDIR